MTSIPASRSAAATTFAPRSWPSNPGFATSTRMGRFAPAISGGTGAVPPARPRRGEPGIVVVAVGEQGADLAPGERLERGLDPVHRPAGADAVLYRRGMGALPGALARFAQGQRGLADLGRRDALEIGRAH